MHPNTITIKTIKWTPGDKWECGDFSFEAETPAGLFRWHEVVPGPRFSDDVFECEAELVVGERTLKVEVDEYPDFGVPSQDGTARAKAFRSTMRETVKKVLARWFESTSELDGLLARPSP